MATIGKVSVLFMVLVIVAVATYEIEAHPSKNEKKLNETTGLETKVNMDGEDTEEPPPPGTPVTQAMLEDMAAKLEEKIENVRNTLINQGGFLSTSNILKSYREQLKQWLPSGTSWELCWRASEHGWAASVFHSRCDHKGPTVTIIRVKDYIFGAYSDASWGGSKGYKQSTVSFIFSLKNKDSLLPFKAPMRLAQTLYNNILFGPTFGAYDIHIANNANTEKNSYTSFGGCYQAPPGYASGADKTVNLLAGSFKFTPSEVEVFYEH